MKNLLLGLCMIAACSGAKNPDADTVAAPVPVAPDPVLTDAPSIYDLPIRLRDSSGRDIGLDVARGRPVLITMFYASCPVACPVLIDELARTLRELPDGVRDEVQVVLVSFDPERDTPAKLRELAAARGLGARWTLAAADGSGSRELAAVLGIKFRKLENGEFFHSSTIVALDGHGRPLARATGVGQREPLLAAFR